jgi:hypothetical protein
MTPLTAIQSKLERSCLEKHFAEKNRFITPSNTDGQRWTTPVQTGLPEGQTGQRQHRKEGC